MVYTLFLEKRIINRDKLSKAWWKIPSLAIRGDTSTIGSID
jgi:hypothetical protein